MARDPRHPTVASVYVLAGLLMAFEATANINVRDFGAKGDGRHDDTVAIQSAFDAAAKAQRSGKTSIYYHAAPAVVFPAGIYLVSDTLKPKTQLIRGIGQAYIRQTNSARDILYFDYMWQGRIDGMHFIGGRTQISLGNRNLDCGHIVIENCKFYEADGVSVATRKGSNSTFLIIKNCIFKYNRQAVISNCDKTTLADCWMSTLPAMENMAAIVNVHGIMTVERLLGVPLVSRKGQRWIDNETGSVYCRDCRFGGEGGGFTPIYNFAKYRPDAGGGPVIAMQNCEVNALGNYPSMAAVYCLEIPNIISLENCLLRGVPGVKIDKRLAVKDYFSQALPGSLAFSIENCTGAFAELPKVLRNPETPGKLEIPGQITRKDAKKRLRQRLDALPPPPPEHQAAPTNHYAPPVSKWTVEALMDATPVKNSERIVLGLAGPRAVLMWRADSSGWPHVEMRDVAVDLDRYPILEMAINNPENTPLETAVKLIDEEEEQLFQLSGQSSRNTLRFDLRNYGLQGRKRLTIRFYYLGIRYIPPKDNQPYTYEKTKPGDYIIIERMHFIPPAS